MLTELTVFKQFQTLNVYEYNRTIQSIITMEFEIYM